MERGEATQGGQGLDPGGTEHVAAEVKFANAGETFGTDEHLEATGSDLIGHQEEGAEL